MQVAAALNDDARMQNFFSVEVDCALSGDQAITGTVNRVKADCFGELRVALEHGVAMDGQVLGALQQIVVRRAERLERFRQIGNLTQTVGIRAEQMILIVFREKGHEIIERVILGETHRSLCAEHGQVFNDEKRLQIAVPHAGQILIDRADADMHAKTVKERVFFQNIVNEIG